jgi:hypothetical protein
LQDTTQQFATGLHHRGLVVGGDFGEVVSFAQHQFGEPARWGVANAFPPGLQAAAQQGLGGALKVLELLAHGQKMVGQPCADDLTKEVFLGLEIQKQGALGHACPRCHFFRPGGRKALLHEQLQGGLDQLARSRLLAAFTSRHRGVLGG